MVAFPTTHDRLIFEQLIILYRVEYLKETLAQKVAHRSARGKAVERRLQGARQFARSVTRDVLASIGECPPIAELVPFVENLAVEKFNEFVSTDLLRQHWVARHANLAPEITDSMRTLAQP